MGSFDEIRGFLRRVRSRRFSMGLLEGGLALSLVCLCTLSIAVLVAMWGDEALLEWVRWLALGSLGVSGALTVYYVSVRPLWRFRRDADVAKAMLPMYPDLGGDVLSCVELEATAIAGQGSDFTKALTLELAHGTATSLRRIPVDLLVSSARAVRFGRYVVVLIVSMTAVAAAFPAPISDGFETLLLGRKPSVTYLPFERTESRDVVVGDISYTLTYPAYTHLASRIESNTSGDLQALLGTQVDIRTRALESAATAYVVFSTDPEHPVPLDISGRELSGKFTVTGPSTFHFELVGEDGVRFVERTSRTVEPVPDGKPNVSVLQPATDVEVRTLEPVRLYFTATDDFGVSRVDLVTARYESGEPATHRRVASPDGGGTTLGMQMSI